MAATNALYRALLQCERRVWRQAHRESSRPARGAGSAHALALAELRALLPARFAGRAMERGVRVASGALRAEIDLLEHTPAGEGAFVQVRATTQVRPRDIDALVLPYWLLEQSGCRVASASIVHLNSHYVRSSQGVDLEALLPEQDVTRQVRFLARDLASDLARIEELVRADEPAIEPSPHCHRPQTCEFFASCTASLPSDWFGWLPGLTGANHSVLRERGVRRIAEIPEDFALSARQARARHAHARGAFVVEPGLFAALADLGPPAGYLDFETRNAVVPPYPGTRALQRLPMQWSLHHTLTGDALTHRGFLAEGCEDPRPEFARTLLESAESVPGPLLVYSAVEAEIVAELAVELPALARRLRALRARLVDLLPLLRENLYDPRFRGSFRLKRVAPVLVPGFGWHDLEGVRDGGAAASALSQLARGDLAAAEAGHLRAALLAYCARDTEALAELHRELRALAQAPQSGVAS